MRMTNVTIRWTGEEFLAALKELTDALSPDGQWEISDVEWNGEEMVCRLDDYSELAEDEDDA